MIADAIAANDGDNEPCETIVAWALLPEIHCIVFWTHVPGVTWTGKSAHPTEMFDERTIQS